MMLTPAWISFLTLLLAGVAFALEPNRYRIVSQQSSDHVLRYHGVHGRTLAYFKAGGVAEANEWDASIDANHPPGYVFRNVLMGRYLSYKLQEEHGLVILDTNTPTKWDVVPVGDNVHHTIRVPSNPLNLTLSVMPYMQSLPLPVGKLEKYAKASNQHFVFYLVKTT
ncbi:MAG: hypothetical protein J3Q66DRAFT_339083 [Benniella sp.]|nr:MAG: hypothetical protein J3Q66DRAFT_339083 [Benniella sp.]